MIITVTLNPAWDDLLFYDAAGAVVERRGEAGGKGINVTRMLQALGTPAIAVTWLAGDTGRQMEARLQQEGIPLQVFDAQGETRTNRKHVRISTGETAEENMPGVAPLNPEAALSAWLQEAVSRGDVVALCGSLPAGVPADFYAGVITRLKEKGVTTVLDASGDALLQGAQAAPFLIKPNEVEFSGWQGRTFDDDNQFRSAVCEAGDRSGSNLLVTRGPGSSFLYYDGACFEASSGPVRPVRTTGAGDALLAGFLSGSAAGQAPEHCFRLAAATAACFVSGKNPEPKNVLPFLDCVRVNRVV